MSTPTTLGEVRARADAPSLAIVLTLGGNVCPTCGKGLPYRCDPAALVAEPHAHTLAVVNGRDPAYSYRDPRNRGTLVARLELVTLPDSTPVVLHESALVTP